MKRILNIAILILSLVGSGIMLTLTYKHLKPDLNLGCGIGVEGCGGVLSSAYSKLGPIPTSLFGLLTYVIIGFISLKYATNEWKNKPSNIRTAPSTLLWALSGAGVVISWWLQYVALYKIQRFCPWCFSSAVTLTLVFILASVRQMLLFPSVLAGDQKLVIGVVSAVFVLGTASYTPQVIEQYQVVSAATTPKTTHRQVGEGNDKPLNIDEVWGIKVDQKTYKTFVNAAGEATKDVRSKGDIKAPILIMEFADYTCPACKEARKRFDALLMTYPGKVRLAFRNRPIPDPNHKWNREAADAVEAAALQGKFWETHDLMYENQEMMADDKFNLDSFAEMVKPLGLDMTRFEADRRGKPAKQRVDQDLTFADAAQVVSTPTFIAIRGKQAWRFDKFNELEVALADPTHALWNPNGKLPNKKQQSSKETNKGTDTASPAAHTQSTAQ